MRGTAGVAVLSLLVSGCHLLDRGQPADEHGHGEAAGHDHPGAESTAFTHFSEGTELFIEIPPLVVGEGVEPAAHVTRLSDFRPLEKGTVTVELSGGGAVDERFTIGEADVPGIFRPAVKPAHAGKREVTVVVKGEQVEARHALGLVTVFPTAEAAEQAAPAEAAQAHGEEDGIAFLMEQQWRMDFALSEVASRPIRSSFEAYGTIRPRAGGEAHVTPPVAGRIRAGDAFPRVGDVVEQNDLLATMTPRLTDQADIFAIRQGYDQARIALKQAEHERARLEGLLADGAVPEDRVIDARFDEEQASSAFQAAKQRLGQARSLQGATGGAGGFELRAPMSGTIVSMDVAPGAFVEQNAHVLRIVDLERLWLEVHVAETHAPLLTEPHGVWFLVEGLDEPFELGKDRIVAVGGVLDAESRTLPLFVEVDNADQRLRVGMFADVHVATGPPREVLAVPVGAVLREAGLPTVYVQRGGERFERRTVRLGDRDGAFLEVREGLVAGERVVSRGAYAVRLAGASGAIPEHGHHH